MRVETGGLGGNRARRRIAVLNEAARILFAEPILRVDLRVRFGEPLIAEVQNAALLLAGLRAVDDACRDIEPVSEFVDEEGSDGRAVGTKSGGGGNLHAE